MILLNIAFPKKGLKQAIETSKEITNIIEDILETVYNDKTSVSSNL